MPATAFQQKTAPFSKLHLDGQNPRHEPASDEPTIIAHLLKENVLPLAQDICTRGLSPLERLAAIPHPVLTGHFIMVEGNRRLCALKLLRDPGKAPSSERKAFKKLADRKITLPRSFELAVFSTREIANEWVALKHGGQQGGVGTKSWNPSQISRFQNSLSGGKRPNALALAVLDYAEDAGIITSDQRPTIALTTVTRYLSNPVVRNALAISSPSELIIDTVQNEFNATLSQFISDIGSGKVHSRSKSPERAAYGNELIKTGLSPTTKLAEPARPTTHEIAKDADTQGSTSVSPANKETKAKNNRSPDFGNKMVRSGYAAHISDATTKRVFDELREIDATKFPFGASCLLRLFMERVCRAYATKFGLGGNGDLAPVINRCAEHMEKHGGATKSVFQIWRQLSSNPAHYLSPGSLSSIVHGGLTPVPSELRRGWTDLEQGFDLMLATLA